MGSSVLPIDGYLSRALAHPWWPVNSALSPAQWASQSSLQGCCKQEDGTKHSVWKHSARPRAGLPDGQPHFTLRIGETWKRRSPAHPPLLLSSAEPSFTCPRDLSRCPYPLLLPCHPSTELPSLLFLLLPSSSTSHIPSTLFFSLPSHFLFCLFFSPAFWVGLFW